MALSTQLIRGALALPLLLMFAWLGAHAEPPVHRRPLIAATDAALHQLCRVHGPRSHVLVLAQAPADLGTLALRWRAPCRV